MYKFLGLFEKLLPLLGYYPRWVQVLFAVCMLTVFVTAVSLVAACPAATKAKDGFVADSGLPALTIAAQNNKRDSVIESVTMFVQWAFQRLSWHWES
jgi:hypothetical protein